jgi:hypothetical protein
MGNALIGYPNYADVNATYAPTFAGGAWSPLLPLTNLQDRRLSRVARSSSAALADTKWDIDLKTQRQVRILALLGHSISTAGKVRVRGFSLVPCIDAYDFSAGWVDVNTPTRVAAGFTCADGCTLDLIGDDNVAAGEQKYLPVVFTGDGTKALRFRVARSSAYSNHTIELSDTTAPALRLALRIDYSAVAPAFSIVGGIGTIASTASRGDGSYDVLVTAPGVIAANNHRLYVTPAATAAADTAQFYIGCFLGWDAAADQLVYDSGLKDAWPAIFPAGSIPSYHPSYATSKLTAEDAVGVAMPFVVVPAAPQNARYWRWEIQDTTNPAGYVDVGRLVMAYGYRPTINMSYGYKEGRDTSLSSRTPMQGGNAIFKDLPSPRTVTFALVDLPADEALVNAMEIQRRTGITKQMFFVFDESDTALLPLRSMLCVQREIPGVEMVTLNRLGVPFSLIEEL